MPASRRSASWADRAHRAHRAHRARVGLAVSAAAVTAVAALPVVALASTASAAPALTGTAAPATTAHRPAEVALPAGLRPEGITSGPGHTYYVGSLVGGRIVTGDLRHGTSRVLLPGSTGRSLRGLFYDGRTDLVWAVGSVGAVSHVWAVDARTGHVVQDTEVPGARFLNDLMVTRTAVWVTDSQVDRLTVIRLGHGGRPTGGAASFLQLTGDWPRYDGTNINANGIRQLSDGSAVLNNSTKGGLWRVDPATGVTRRIPVSGGPGLVGGDGLELRGHTLYDVRGSGQAEVSVLRLTHGKHGWTAFWRGALTDPRLDLPSTATLSGGTLWAVNARFSNPTPDTAAYWITPLPARH